LDITPSPPPLPGHRSTTIAAAIATASQISWFLVPGSLYLSIEAASFRILLLIAILGAHQGNGTALSRALRRERHLSPSDLCSDRSLFLQPPPGYLQSRLPFRLLYCLTIHCFPPALNPLHSDASYCHSPPHSSPRPHSCHQRHLGLLRCSKVVTSGPWFVP
jgi:hypothetical protein